MSEALELQIEDAWLALARLSPTRTRTLYLTVGRRVVWRPEDVRGFKSVEVGTYGRKVSLRDLREDVFYAHENFREAA